MVDATQVSSIKIDTGYAGVKEYPIFKRPDGKNSQCAIILGMNGSGKSTLARALSTETGMTEFLDKDGGLLESDFLNVHVFNEQFIVDNFHVPDIERLESVILLGDSSDNEKNITTLREMKSRKLEERGECCKEIDALKVTIGSHVENVKNLINPNSSSLNGLRSGYLVRECVEGFISNVESILGGNSNSIYDIESLTTKGQVPDEDLNRWLAEFFGLVYFEVSLLGPDPHSDITVLNDNLLILKAEIDVLCSQMRSSKSSADRKNIDSRIHRKGSSYISCLQSIIAQKFPNENKEISEIIEGCHNFSKVVEKKNSLDKEIEGIDSEIDIEFNSIESKNRAHSAKEINKLLNMVFGPGGIKLAPGDVAGYRIINNRGYVTPNRLSIGERNVLSLCYFFAKIAEGGDIKESLRQDRIIVLDDPVSSFDKEKKYGVTLLLAYLFQYILAEDSDAKLIIMTHDNSFALNMKLAVSAINSSGLQCWKLSMDKDESLEYSNFKYVDKYRDMLEDIYNFAVSKLGDSKVPESNEIRRVWESFMLFELGQMNISDMTSVKNLSRYFKNDSRIEKFLKVFVPMLFVNVGSHSQNNTMDGNLYLDPDLDDDQYYEYARCIICFMYFVAPHHIVWRLGGSAKDKDDRIEKLDILREEVLDKYKDE